jgi:hypothetical protein
MRFHKPTIFVLLLLAFVLPQKAFAQPINPLISFSVESCNLDEALEKLFAEYELNVAFSKAELSKIRIEGYSCSYKSVEEVLSDLLRGTDYGFKKVGKQYVIRKNLSIIPEKPDIQESTSSPPEEVIAHKTDTIVNKLADTIHIIDTVQLIRTVMRYDTVVKTEIQHDTVYTLKYKGVEFPWPSFKDNGWFITPALEISSLVMKREAATMENPMEMIPVSAYGFGLDAGYKYQRLSMGVSLAYKSLKYNISFNQSLTEGDYYVNDTLDSYYVVHPGGDTTYQYILDSTYIPLTTTNFAFRDVNRLDYLSLGFFASLDFLKFDYFRMFVKAGVSADILLSCSGSYFVSETPYQQEVTKPQAESVRWSCFGGLGFGFKAGNHFEIVPEVRYRGMVGLPYYADIPLDMHLRFWDFRLGLTYYF